jgi:hypothetical protein
MVTVSFIASLVGVGILIIAGIVLVVRYSRLIPKLRSIQEKKTSSPNVTSESDTITSIDDTTSSPQFLTSSVATDRERTTV